MEESRAVSDVKIRAMTVELDELRPLNQSLQTEVESLRRHLALALGELKNPIVIPIAVDEKENYQATDDEEDEDEDEDGGSEDGIIGVGAQTSWQDDVDSLMQDLSLFRRKIADDHSIFDSHESVGEVSVY